MTHYELVQRAIRWLKNTGKCQIVASEIVSASFEIPDAIGWTSIDSTLIECKATRSDFLRDRHKISRKFPDNGLGNWRYYMTEPNLIKPDELPRKWGLLEVYPKIVRRKILAERFASVHVAWHERPLLFSLLLKNAHRLDKFRGKLDELEYCWEEAINLYPDLECLFSRIA